MKISVILLTLAICWELHETKYTTPPPYKGKDPTAALMDSWYNPPAAFKKKINLSVKEYDYWTSATKFVAPGAKLQPTYIPRFCKCKKPYDKRSLMSRVKRQGKKNKFSAAHIGPSAKRMEWRRMSVSMRKLFIQHFNNLAVKRQGEEKSRLQIFADWHREVESPGAHGGPAFLPWHREFLFRLENCLRDDGYPGGLPYWNSGLDHNMENPSESAIFTTQELGVSNGNLGTPFNKVKLMGDCVKGRKTTVERNAGRQSKDNLLHSTNVEDLANSMGRDYLTFAAKLEGHHNGVHPWVGGHMNTLNCTGYEPLFYLHHCYIDYLWEQYRMKQKPGDRASHYPKDEAVRAYMKNKDGKATDHYQLSHMMPFDTLLVSDGMKNQYTDVYYHYDDVPAKCKSDDDCNGQNKGDLLWCTGQRCQGKIREGGACQSNLRNHHAQCHCAVKNKKPRCAGNKCRC